jgi:hypothetical protein
LAFGIKYPGFIEEQEIRLIRLVPDKGTKFDDPKTQEIAQNVEFLERDTGRAVYPLKLDEVLLSCITKIVLGPSSSNSESKLKTELVRLGHRIPIKKSLIPYRASA